MRDKHLTADVFVCLRAVKMVSRHDAKNRIANCGWEMKGNHPHETVYEITPW